MVFQLQLESMFGAISFMAVMQGLLNINVVTSLTTQTVSAKLHVDASQLNLQQIQGRHK